MDTTLLAIEAGELHQGAAESLEESRWQLRSMLGASDDCSDLYDKLTTDEDRAKFLAANFASWFLDHPMAALAVMHFIAGVPASEDYRPFLNDMWRDLVSDAERYGTIGRGQDPAIRWAEKYFEMRAERTKLIGKCQRLSDMVEGFLDDAQSTDRVAKLLEQHGQMRLEGLL